MAEKFFRVILCIVLISAITACEPPAPPPPIASAADPVFSHDSGTYTEVIELSLGSDTPEATIRYTTDETDPSISQGILYDTPLTIEESVTVKAIAYKNGMNPSSVVSKIYSLSLAKAEAPAFNYDSGTYTEYLNVTIASSTADATIRYTTDGSAPNRVTGIVYTGAFEIQESTTVRAVAYRNDTRMSDTGSRTYTIDLARVATPAADIVTGSYNNDLTVTLSCATENAIIRYTTTGIDPTSSTGTVYTTPIGINGTVNLRVGAFKYGMANSLVSSYNYSMSVASLSGDVAAGTYNNDKSLQLTTATANADIWYTTDNTTPTAGGGTSAKYTNPILLNKAMTLKAIGFKNGYTSTSLLSRNYSFTVSTITADTPGGTYNTEKSVALSTPTTGAQIWYTTDNSTPSAGGGTSQVYSGPVAIDRSRTLRAIGVKANYTNSSLFSSTFTLVVPNPVISLAAATYEFDQTTTISVPTGSSVRFTTNGTTPSATVGTLYGGESIAVDKYATTVKAIAYRTGWTSSSVVTSSYKIKLATNRTFNSVRFTDNTWYSLSSTMLSYSDHCAVYVQNGLSVTGVQAQAICTEFENNIYNTVRDNFYVECDEDENGRVILLIQDIIDDFLITGNYKGGYFYGYHEYSGLDYPYSNLADMLFLDANPVVPGSEEFNSIIAHEFQHLVNFNKKVFVDGTSGQDIWINEGLSSASEYIYTGAHLQDRIDYYNDDPFGSILYGNNFFTWKGYWEVVKKDEVANYATVYLFFQWLRIHSSVGTGIYKQILSNTSTDYSAVTNVASADPGFGGSFSSWSTLLRTWMIANFLNSPAGLTGYKGEISLSMWGFANTGGVQYQIEHGERLIVATNETKSFTPPAEKTEYPYGYAGITIATGAVDTSSPYTGDAILVYHQGVTTLYDPLTVVLPEILSSKSSGFIFKKVALSAPLPAHYRIDVTIDPVTGKIIK